MENNQSFEIIRKEIASILRNHNPQLSEAELELQVKQLTAYLECPLNSHKPVPELACYFCAQGEFDIELMPKIHYKCKGVV